MFQVDALSASGLRAIRYSKELRDEVNLVYANDISESSVRFINENVDLSQVDRSKIRSFIYLF